MMPHQPERGLQKTGYLEIKQSSKVKNRKLKAWKRRWIVVHQMSDLASGTYAAKVDVYADEDTGRRTPSDKQTFILEAVTSVQHAMSKTHPHAFEIVETDPVLIFCGESDKDTLAWMNTFKKIFFPDTAVEEYGMFDVSILPNVHTTRLNLAGKYNLIVNASDVTLQTTDRKIVVKWDLSSLKRFYLESELNSNLKRILVILTGPNSSTGEGTFRFQSSHADKILEAIGRCIQEVLALKKRQRQQTAGPARDRVVSFTASERNFRQILDSSEQRLSRTASMLSSGNSPSPPCSPLAMPTIHAQPVAQAGHAPPFTPTGQVPPFTQTGQVQPFTTGNEAPFTQTGSATTFTPTGHAPPVLQTGNSTAFTPPGNDSSVTPTGHASGTPPIPQYAEIPLHKNASVPNIAGTLVVENLATNGLERKNRTMSLNSRTSVSSRDSGIGEGDVSRPPERTRRPSAEKRAFSNSFDSAVSTGSYEESKRKLSEVEQPIKEESLPAPIYNDIDDMEVNANTRRKVNNKDKERSGTEQRKENEYEDLDKYRGNKDGDSTSVKPEDKAETEPPALPERPRILRLRQVVSHEDGDAVVMRKTAHQPSNVRHSCMASILTHDLKNSQPLGDVAGEDRANFMSKSASKDIIYASIPDMDMDTESSAVSEAIPIRKNGRLLTQTSVDATEMCLDIFAPSVESWVMSIGTPPDLPPRTYVEGSGTSSSLPSEKSMPTQEEIHAFHSNPATPVVQHRRDTPTVQSSLYDKPTDDSSDAWPSSHTHTSQPAVYDLLGLSDSSGTNPSATEDLTVTKPADLLKGFDPFEPSVDLMMQDNDWLSPSRDKEVSPVLDTERKTIAANGVTSAQNSSECAQPQEVNEDPYFDMSSSRTSGDKVEDEQIYMAPSRD